MKNLLEYSERLKHLQRTGWIRKGIKQPETVASHSWQMAIMALQLSGLMHTFGEEYDFDKVIKLCLCHDLAESIIGDITPEEAIYTNKNILEEQAMLSLAEHADFSIAYALLKEYNANQTMNAKLANDLDKIDMYAQALAYERKYHNKDLREFKEHAIRCIQTKLGLAILNDLR